MGEALPTTCWRSSACPPVQMTSSRSSRPSTQPLKCAGRSKLAARRCQQHARTHGVGRVARMKQSKRTTLVVWIAIGLIGVGLNACHDISARIKDRPEALELYGTIAG